MKLLLAALLAAIVSAAGSFGDLKNPEDKGVRFRYPQIKFRCYCPHDLTEQITQIACQRLGQALGENAKAYAVEAGPPGDRRNLCLAWNQSRWGRTDLEGIEGVNWCKKAYPRCIQHTWKFYTESEFDKIQPWESVKKEE